MSDFIVCLPHPGQDGSAVDGVILKLQSVLTEVLPGGSAVTGPGNSILASGTNENGYLRYYADDRGWIVIKGLIFDCQSTQAQVSPRMILDHLLDRRSLDWGRFEGSFAVIAWDSNHRRAWVFNDQVASLNLYIGSYKNCDYVATTIVPLGRVLGIPLSPAGIREFLCRGSVTAPLSVLSGFRRLSVGEFAIHENGQFSLNRNWLPFHHRRWAGGIRECADQIASLLVDRARRYGTFGQPVIADLTGGLDSRMVCSALACAGVDFAVTVNGNKDDADVRIARKVAEKAGWPIYHYTRPCVWSNPIDGKRRREFVYRTNGELPFHRIYIHAITRPELAQQYCLHVLGGLGELLRWYPWSQEFFGIGRRRQANIDRLLRYRFLQDLPQVQLIPPIVLSEMTHVLRGHIHQILKLGPGCRTTEQLDAIYVWKMTSHVSLYTSSTSGWLPSVPLMGCAELIETALSVPWNWKLTSNLQRRITHQMSPRAAEVETEYGGSGRPIGLRSLHREVLQTYRQGKHLFRKLGTVSLKGLFGGRFAGQGHGKDIPAPVLDELRAFMDPSSMFSRRIYLHDGLTKLLRGPDSKWHQNESLIMRMATIEQLCRETGFELASDFVYPVKTSTRASNSSSTA